MVEHVGGQGGAAGAQDALARAGEDPVAGCGGNRTVGVRERDGGGWLLTHEVSLTILELTSVGPRAPASTWSRRQIEGTRTPKLQNHLVDAGHRTYRFNNTFQPDNVARKLTRSIAASNHFLSMNSTQAPQQVTASKPAEGSITSSITTISLNSDTRYIRIPCSSSAMRYQIYA